MSEGNPIIRLVGEESFRWLSQDFSEETTFQDVPDEILERIASVDITLRDYSRDRNAITAIAFITFAYRMANRVQEARFGGKDILLVKILARRENVRRTQGQPVQNGLPSAPVFELITGQVGDCIRAMKTMNSPM